VDRQYQPSSRGRQYWIWQSPLLTNFLLPKGAPQITVVQESQFGPAVTCEAKFPLPSLATETEIVQQVIDLPPGWRTERAYHGFAVGLIMQGEVTYRIG